MNVQLLQLSNERQNGSDICPSVGFSTEVVKFTKYPIELEVDGGQRVYSHYFPRSKTFPMSLKMATEFYIFSAVLY
jgi:hypothetical protein